MKKLITLLLAALPVFLLAQNVGIGTTTPNARLEVKDTVVSRLKISSKFFGDTSQLILSNRLIDLYGTDMILTSNNEEGLRVIARSDLPGNNSDSILTITPAGRLGINKISLPAYTLDVNGDINTTGTMRVNGNAGTNGQILRSNGDGTMGWGDVSEYKNFEVFNFTTTGAVQNWSVPASVSKIKVELWGGGGYGTNIFLGGVETAGAGGGGGGYITGYFTVTGGSSLSVVVGGGGVAGVNGGNSRVDVSTKALIANGGTNGIYNGAATRFDLGIGGNFSAINTTNYFGLQGQGGYPTTTVYEQKSATDFIRKLLYGNGGNAGNTHNTGGTGGFDAFNITASLTLQKTNGTTGLVPGGGGASIGPAGGGANGGNGIVIIYY